MLVSLLFVLFCLIGIKSISDDECLRIAKSCYEKTSLDTCYLDNLPEGCHCCYNKFYLNNEPMENCVVASGIYYQQYYNLKPGDVISEYGLTYKSISNTCSKYYNSGNQTQSRNNTNSTDSNSSKKYFLSIIILFLYIFTILN